MENLSCMTTVIKVTDCKFISSALNWLDYFSNSWVKKCISFLCPALGLLGSSKRSALASRPWKLEGTGFSNSRINQEWTHVQDALTCPSVLGETERSLNQLILKGRNLNQTLRYKEFVTGWKDTIRKEI